MAMSHFFAYLSRPEVQAEWHQATGYLPITRAAYELTAKSGYYEKNPGTAVAMGRYGPRTSSGASGLGSMLSM